MFKFIAAGLPVVASNFPMWKEILEGAGCGICVDPTKAEQVRDACLYMIEYPEEAQRMGKQGRKAVLEKYSWVKEEQKLIELYKSF